MGSCWPEGNDGNAELHLLRSRLQGGKLHKAQKGELCFPLPVAFVTMISDAS